MKASSGSFFPGTVLTILTFRKTQGGQYCMLHGNLANHGVLFNNAYLCAFVLILDGRNRTYAKKLQEVPWSNHEDTSLAKSINL